MADASGELHTLKIPSIPKGRAEKEGVQKAHSFH